MKKPYKHDFRTITTAGHTFHVPEKIVDYYSVKLIEARNENIELLREQNKLKSEIIFLREDNFKLKNLLGMPAGQSEYERIKEYFAEKDGK